MLQVAIHYAQAGDVVLVAAGEYEEAGTFGDVLGNAMKSKGIAAMVTDSGVRDTQDLIELGLPGLLGQRLHQGHGEGDPWAHQPPRRVRRRDHLPRRHPPR